MGELIKLMTAGEANNVSNEDLKKWSSIAVRGISAFREGRIAKVANEFVGVIEVSDSGEGYAVCRPAYVVVAGGVLS